VARRARHLPVGSHEPEFIEFDLNFGKVFPGAGAPFYAEDALIRGMIPESAEIQGSIGVVEPTRAK
jgi:hypothetical protein